MKTIHRLLIGLLACVFLSACGSTSKPLSEREQAAQAMQRQLAQRQYFVNRLTGEGVSIVRDLKNDRIYHVIIPGDALFEGYSLQKTSTYPVIVDKVARYIQTFAPTTTVQIAVHIPPFTKPGEGDKVVNALEQEQVDAISLSFPKHELDTRLLTGGQLQSLPANHPEHVVEITFEDPMDLSYCFNGYTCKT